MPGVPASNPTEPQDENKTVRLHITPLRPELLKVYLAPSVLASAQNVSYHAVETFPEKGFGYVELPALEAEKIKKKLNGTTLRGSKVRIEMAKPEKRKVREEADAAKEKAEAERPTKRVKKEKRKKEVGVLDGVELPDDRKVKRGWTEPPTKNKKERKEKKDKKDKDKAREQKHSKYTREPELLFKAKLTPVAATEVAHKEKSKEKKKEKKEKNKSKSREVVIHEFEKNSKTPSFLKETKVATTKKPAVDYVNGVGWVDEDGTVVEPETGRAKHRRALELVDKPTEAQKAWIDGLSLPQSSTPKTTKGKKEKKATPPPETSSEEEDDESSVVSSSSEDASSDSESEAESEAESAAPSPPQDANGTRTPELQQALPSEEKDVHPLEALFKRPKSTPGATSTPAKKLTPINTSFSFFDSNEESAEVNGEPVENVPSTPFTQKDLEWRGLRSAAPTPDTAAIGRRFSFDWRKGSHEADDDEEMEDVDPDAEQQLSQNTMANASAKHLPGVTEEDENEAEEVGLEQQVTEAEEQPESEFRKWFWENRGDLNRAWKKRRRDALKSKRHSENRKMTGGGRKVV
ncbi:Nn.00g087730.m01.CDS01 [Neocucurbitaria sp. VM-36]